MSIRKEHFVNLLFECSLSSLNNIFRYALESIKYGKFSTKSDVWSFGVTLWEMFSYGEEPIIPGVKDDDLLFNLEKGVRLGCPGTCPVDIYHFMLSCWQSDSHGRPTFTNIREQIDELKEKS